MELPVLSVALVQSFLICLARVAALVASLPVIGTGPAPMHIKVALIGMLSLLLFPAVQPFIQLPVLELPALALLVVNESILGLMMGFLVQMVFIAVQVGGEIIGYKMGFAAANIFDPANNAQVSIVAQFQNIFAILLFFTLDIHHLFFEAVAESFRLLPPGQVDPTGNAALFLVSRISDTFLLAIQLSAPILALLIMSNLVLGVMGRIFPQLNAFVFSFPLNIGIAFTVIGMTLGLMATLLQSEFLSIEARFLQLFQAL